MTYDYDPDEEEAFYDEQHTDERDVLASWEPVDLGPALRGERTIPTPCVLHRDDGRALFYPRSVNWLHGDSGVGKSMLVAETIRQELAAGHRVLMLDYEADDAVFVGRLLDLTIPKPSIADQVLYLHPDSTAATDVVDHLLDLIDAYEITLVVVDSVGEAFGVEGLDENKDTDVGPWVRRVLRRIADAGPCVVVIDHATKAADNVLHPSGSKRKRAAITGAGYLAETVYPFSRTQAGLIRVTCAKDRHGNYARGEVAALVHVEPYPDGGIGLKVSAPPPAKDARTVKDDQRVDVVRDLVMILKASAEPLSARELIASITVKCGTDVKRAAIDAAERVGAIKVTPGGRGAHLHTFVRDLKDDDFDRLRT